MPTVKPETQTTADTTLLAKVEAARLKAREVLRMRRLNDLLAQLNPAGKDLEAVQKASKRVQARLAGLKYDMDKLDAEHPEFEYKKERFEKDVKYTEEDVKHEEQVLKSRQKYVDELKAKLDDVQTGKWLCNLDDLNALAEQLLTNNA